MMGTYGPVAKMEIEINELVMGRKILLEHVNSTGYRNLRSVS